MMRPAARTARHSSETPFSIRFPHETPKASPKGGFLEVFGVVEKDL